MKRTFFFIAVLLFTIIGCSKDDNSVKPIFAKALGVYIVNEGNFNRGNSTLTMYIPDSNQVYNNVFESVNGKKLGDVGNSIAIRGTKAYIVVNGSNRIEVISTETQKSLATIDSPPGASPRNIAFQSDSVGYVSNLFDNSTSILDLKGNAVNGRVGVGNNPEELMISGNYIFVTNSGFGTGNTVSVIDIKVNVVVKTLRVSDNPINIRQWNATTAVVLCGGDFGDPSNPNDDTPGRIHFINLSNQTVADTMTIGGHPFEMAIDKNDFLYTIGSSGIVKINLKTKSILTQNFITGFFYTVAYDKLRDRLYVSDAKDFVQPGVVKIYDMNGSLQQSFTAGVNPGFIAFIEQ